jgi:hypothetical protein
MLWGLPYKFHGHAGPERDAGPFTPTWKKTALHIERMSGKPSWKRLPREGASSVVDLSFASIADDMQLSSVSVLPHLPSSLYDCETCDGTSQTVTWASNRVALTMWAAVRCFHQRASLQDKSINTRTQYSSDARCSHDHPSNIIFDQLR